MVLFGDAGIYLLVSQVDLVGNFNSIIRPMYRSACNVSFSTNSVDSKNKLNKNKYVKLSEDDIKSNPIEYLLVKLWNNVIIPMIECFKNILSIDPEKLKSRKIVKIQKKLQYHAEIAKKYLLILMDPVTDSFKTRTEYENCVKEFRKNLAKYFDLENLDISIKYIKDLLNKNFELHWNDHNLSETYFLLNGFTVNKDYKSIMLDSVLKFGYYNPPKDGPVYVYQGLLNDPITNSGAQYLIKLVNKQIADLASLSADDLANKKIEILASLEANGLVETSQLPYIRQQLQISST